ncbi:hypothetical protein UFOVP237_17 [uncultured Caudovirales phage]|uniref:Uncharacterized protein n=1 Tax=uncultured Caudovirales phage TaxID=2100421 RepID=A0A6J7WPA0_9CAUD|nr:hypothetical protein UFOVP237_17 [uncultured Caudovirales phage]
MKDFKHTHKMHHGAHPLFGKGSARPAPAAMPPMMPPGGMGGIQSAGEDMASSAPGGMSGGAPSGMGSGGGDAGSSGAGYKRGGKVFQKVMKKAEGGGVTEAQRVGKSQSASNKAFDKFKNTASDWADFSPSGIGKKSNMDLSMDAAKSYMAKQDADNAKEQQGYKKGGMAKGGNWIKGAIKHPGALHRELGIPEGKKIPAGKLAKATHSSNPTLAKRARLAQTLKGFKK